MCNLYPVGRYFMHSFKSVSTETPGHNLIVHRLFKINNHQCN